MIVRSLDQIIGGENDVAGPRVEKSALSFSVRQDGILACRHDCPRRGDPYLGVQASRRGVLLH
jgi:hypothetical protein